MQKQNFKLDNEFYPDSIVLLGIEAFQGFSIKKTSSGIEIEDENPQQLFEEFSNYCLAISSEKFE